MAGKAGTLEFLAQQVGLALQPLQRQLTRESIIPFLAQLGLQFPSELTAQSAFMDALRSGARVADVLPGLLTRLATDIDSDNEAGIIQDGQDIIGQIGALVSALKQMGNQLGDVASGLPGMNPGDVTTFAADLAKNTLDYMLVAYLRSVAPGAVGVANALGIIKYIPNPGDPFDPAHPPFMSWHLQLDNLGQLLSSPTDLLKALYDWGSPTFDGTKLLPRLNASLNLLGFSSEIFGTGPDSTLASALVSVKAIPATNPPTNLPGLLATLRYSITSGFDLTLTLSTVWSVRIQAQGAFDAGLQITITPPANVSLKLPSVTLNGQLGMDLLARGLDSSHPIIIVGNTGGTRLQAESFTFGIGVIVTGDPLADTRSGELLIHAEIAGGKAVIDTSGGGGLLSALTSDLRVEAAFGLRATWSPSTGLRLEGSSNIQIRIPTNISIGPIKVENILLGCSPSAGVIPIEISTGLSIKQGPVHITIDRVGLELIASFPPHGDGNLGPLKLEPKFKPPDGLGLTLDGEGLTGGGFLDHTTGPPERYAGAFFVKAPKFSIGAFAIYEKNAAGDTSFVIVMGSRFEPGFPIGFGLVCTGVGGLIGINRRANTDAFRARLTSGTSGNVLFTDDPVKNAPAMLGDLEELFPAAEDIHTIGLTVRLNWGGGQIASFDIGVLIEVPGPSKVIIIGTARVVIGKQIDAPLVNIRLDFIGVIDIPKKDVAFDATLIDSSMYKVLPLSGDAAFRMNSGDRPYAMLSMGGFHPAFNPEPAIFPKLRPLATSFQKGPLSLTMQSYFAITTNTFQVGAKVNAHVSAGRINATGSLSFDALIQFKPFYFAIDFEAKFRVKYGDTTLAGVTCRGKLSGPGPLVLSGRFCFEILFFDVCWSDTFVISDAVGDVVSAIENLVKDALEAEISNPNNLEALGGDDKLVAVSRKTLAEVLVSPIGQITWSQTRAPLNTALDRFEGSPLSARETVEAVVDLPAQNNAGTVKDWFSPGTFMNLSQSEAMNMKAFERLDAGIIMDFGMKIDPAPEPRDHKFITKILPDETLLPPISRIPHPNALLDAVSGRNAATAMFSAPQVISVTDETWNVRMPDGSFIFGLPAPTGELFIGEFSEADAHQRARSLAGVALPKLDVMDLRGAI